MPSKRTIPRICRHCGADFLAHASAVNAGEGFYCNTAHRIASQRQGSAPVLQEDGTAHIPLRARDGSARAYAVIDAADAEWASQWAWYLSDGYARRSDTSDRQQRKRYLHRELFGLVDGDGLEVDHIDRVRLNCVRSNLRRGPKMVNRQNLPSYAGASSAHRGVAWRKDTSKWMAYARISGKMQYFGCFTNEDEAAEAARAGRARLMPYAVD